MGESRIRNTSINTVVGLICQIVSLGLNFIMRTIFIKILGAEYLGVNGLFTEILLILSFAELGIGNAIIFSMYKPLADGDEKKIGSLMVLYKKAYTVIGVIIAVVGVCLTPFLKFLIEDVPDITENVAVLYLLFLLNTVCSYFFVYKKNIIIAAQKNYIVLIINLVVMVAKTILQVIFLVITHQYIMYLLIQILCTLIDNILCSFVADRKFPFLKAKAVPLSKTETQKIFSDVKSLAIYKFGSVILNGTNNVLISAWVGVYEVGLVSNYVLLTTSCNSILSRVTEAFTASIGNLNAAENKEKQYDIFKKLLFITSWIYGYVSVGLAIVAKPFIIEWIGSEYLLQMSVFLAILVEFYVKGVHFATYTYRTTLGLFNQGKWSAAMAAVINLVLSIILFRYMGLVGIFIATPTARVLTTGIVDPVLIYKYAFKRNVLEYYFMYLGYVVLFIAIGIGCNFACSNITIGGWTGVCLKSIVVTLIFNGMVLIVFSRTKILRELWKMGLSLVRRR